jgi:hypothetical protein
LKVARAKEAKEASRAREVARAKADAEADAEAANGLNRQSTGLGYYEEDEEESDEDDYKYERGYPGGYPAADYVPGSGAPGLASPEQARRLHI